VRAKDGARRADARQADEGKVGAEDEAEEARRKVDDEEARRAHHALDLRTSCETTSASTFWAMSMKMRVTHLRGACALSEHVEEQVDDACVEEDRDEEPERLVGSARPVDDVEAAEAADVGHGACASLRQF